MTLAKETIDAMIRDIDRLHKDKVFKSTENVFAALTAISATTGPEIDGVEKDEDVAYVIKEARRRIEMSPHFAEDNETMRARERELAYHEAIIMIQFNAISKMQNQITRLEKGMDIMLAAVAALSRRQR